MQGADECAEPLIEFALAQRVRPRCLRVSVQRCLRRDLDILDGYRVSVTFTRVGRGRPLLLLCVYIARIRTKGRRARYTGEGRAECWNEGGGCVGYT